MPAPVASSERKACPRLVVEPEDPLGVHVRHSRLVSGRQRRGSDELNRCFGGLEGVVDREHHIVDANFLNGGDQSRVGEHPGGSDRDVGPEVLRGQLFQRVLELEDLEAGIKPGQLEGKEFPHVPEDDLGDWLEMHDHAVLGATAYSCLKKELELGAFDLVVVDEASQVRVPEAAVAASLVGDPSVFGPGAEVMPTKARATRVPGKPDRANAAAVIEAIEVAANACLKGEAAWPDWPEPAPPDEATDEAVDLAETIVFAIKGFKEIARDGADMRRMIGVQVAIVAAAMGRKG